MAAAGASPSSSSLGPGPLARAYWLPPHGHGNGLDAPAWAPIADIPPEDVEVLLATLRVASVPGYAAGVGPPGKRRSYRLWVASLRYSAFRRRGGAANHSEKRARVSGLGPRPARKARSLTTVLRISTVRATEVLDSRGRPTVAVRVSTAGGITGQCLVPSGASTGSGEAVELRDGDPARFHGLGVQRAVAAVNGEIAELVTGRPWSEGHDLDHALIQLDGMCPPETSGGNRFGRRPGRYAHIRALHANRHHSTAPYLGNLWRAAEDLLGWSYALLLVVLRRRCRCGRAVPPLRWENRGATGDRLCRSPVVGPGPPPGGAEDGGHPGARCAPRSPSGGPVDPSGPLSQGSLPCGGGGCGSGVHRW